jgi:hypothetical protein
MIIITHRIHIIFLQSRKSLWYTVVFPPTTYKVVGDFLHFRRDVLHDRGIA